MKKLFVFLFLVTCVIASGFGQSSGEQSFIIEGEVKKSLRIGMKDLGTYPSTEVKAKDKDDKEHTFKGTLLSVLLDSAGVTLGKQLRGEHLTKYVVVTATDNYKVVYALADIDPEFSSNAVLIATHIDGKLLPKEEGAFRLISPADKRPTRWVRQVRSISVVFAK